jgi:hypothetical protein
MKKNIFYSIFLSLLFLPTLIFCQNFPKDYWHEGELTLFNGENMQGHIKYDLEKDNVQITLQNNKSVKTYSSRNVESFEFIDAVLRIRRSFFALPFRKSADYESPMFFELLADSNVALLNRETVIMRTMPVYGYGGMAPMFNNVPVLVDNFYFLVKAENKVVEFTHKKEMILALFKDKAEKIEAYLQNNKVNLSQRKDLMQLVDYYNSIQ